uniref:Transmembrane protein 200C n=1 Tax=Fundulus heteroclitus TaxID=8078 RepID=A0A3Q2Q9P0_FUNHE
MIATGGLLRMNRRQDSLRSKNRAENKRKRKSKKKKKNDVVVVKGKLNLCSPAGLVAAVGVVILMVGISMAVLGYWPSQNHHSNSSIPDPAPHCGILCDFLDNYLYSDNLKVFGPLVMGIGIFLFICANAVLHENRDKKTKIINLRDIYSTVIDLHSIRSKEYSPLNGLVNYTQSRSAEGPSASFPASGALTRSSWPSTGLHLKGELDAGETFRRSSLAGRPRSLSRDVQSFTDTVYSIYKDYSNSSEQAPQPRQWETTSIVTSSVNAFTLPVIKLNNCEVEESERAEAEGRSEEEVPQPHAHWTQLFPPEPVSTGTGSNRSLNSFADPPRLARRCSLSVSGGRQSDRARRFSCPRLERSNSKGYIKLSDLGGESFEAPDTQASCHDYVMITKEIKKQILNWATLFIKTTTTTQCSDVRFLFFQCSKSNIKDFKGVLVKICKKLFERKKKKKSDEKVSSDQTFCFLYNSRGRHCSL